MNRSMSVAVLFLVPLLAAGDTLSVALTEVASITDGIRGRTVGRVVFSIPLPEPVREARVDFVKLEFPAFLEDTGATVTIFAHECLTPWERGRVSWYVPWRNPGGDFDSVVRARFTSLPGDDRPVVLDITGAVRDWQKGRGRNGLFLVRPNHEGGGFGEEWTRLLDALRKARVKYYFSPVQD